MLNMEERKEVTMMQGKRSKGVTMYGWYFIVQSIVAAGFGVEAGMVMGNVVFPLAILVFILFLSIGIGLLKLRKSARIAAEFFFILAAILAILYNANLYRESRSAFLYCLLPFVLLCLSSVYFFNRPRVKAQFIKK